MHKPKDFQLYFKIFTGCSAVFVLLLPKPRKICKSNTFLFLFTDRGYCKGNFYFETECKFQCEPSDYRVPRIPCVRQASYPCNRMLLAEFFAISNIQYKESFVLLLLEIGWGQDIPKHTSTVWIMETKHTYLEAASGIVNLTQPGM